MDLLLYRLNVSALAISAVMIALFFAVLRRSVRRVEMRWWTLGWTANAVALILTFLFWYFQPPTPWHGPVFGAYLLAKTVYIWLLLRGALELRHLRPRWISTRAVLPVMLIVCAAAVFVVTTRDRLGLVTSLAIAAGFSTGVVPLLRAREFASGWLGVGFLARAVLAAAEAAAYGVNVAAGGDLTQSAFYMPANVILASHYAFDTGAEWLIAMGCIIAVSERTQAALRLANTQMLEAQENLRRLADRDPLTALANRRTLPDVFRAVQPRGAMLIFLDLDAFKRVNDEHGHHAGDECLTRFAAALTSAFRPGDAVVRFAGDEFLVVASGLDEAAVAERVEALRARAALAPRGALPIFFSCGVAHLAAGGNPDEALKAADEAMYRAKPSSSRGTHRVIA